MRHFRPRFWLLAVLLLVLHAAVFAMYLQADFLLTLANQVWGCF